MNIPGLKKLYQSQTWFTLMWLLLAVVFSLQAAPIVDACLSQNPTGSFYNFSLGYTGPEHVPKPELHRVYRNFYDDYAPDSPVATKSVANPVPNTLAWVIPGKGPYPTLGAPGAGDVFVTAADDIAGLNAPQIAKRLTIPESDTFTVVRFKTPQSGVASPINRTDPGFIGGGRTAGGAREFVIPNQSIPDSSVVEVVR